MRFVVHQFQLGENWHVPKPSANSQPRKPRISSAFVASWRLIWNVLSLNSRFWHFRQSQFRGELLSPTIPQTILDRLTDVAMPKLANERPPHEFITALGLTLPVRRCRALVLGSGAAGLRAAVELKRHDIDVAIASQSAFGGTSACSGSDKQTLHTANSSDRGDDFRAMADALGAGGAMDEDAAYVEAVGSARALSSLQYLGLPIPQDPLGGVLRYQTDHDEVGRATSCGPRTSRLMVKVLAEEALRLGVPIINHTTAVRLLVDPGSPRRPAGVLAIRPKCRADDNPLGLTVFFCDFLVIASGGPGELYRDSVYPRHCFGSLGLALEAGLEAVNLTESQFGIGTSRERFPWNLSGTYVQCMPYVYSLDSRGREHNFLGDYYRTTRELASNVFRKGYQWPFHATRMLDFGSSLFDLAVFRETQAGRKVFMDFNRNPLAVPGDAEFDLERLDRRCARLPQELRRPTRKASGSPSQNEPFVDRTLQALQIRHHAEAAGIRNQQPAHEWRARCRHMGTNEPRRMLCGRRSCGNPWRHPSRRRGAERRPGFRYALRRTYRFAPRGRSRSFVRARTGGWRAQPNPRRSSTRRAR